MTPPEEVFVREIKLALKSSSEFRRTVESALGKLMGEEPAQILVMSITNDGFKSPVMFVREVDRVFGQGALPIYSAVLETAKDPDWLLDMRCEPLQLKARTGGLAPTTIGRLYEGENERDFYLHDHRDPSDFSEEDAR